MQPAGWALMIVSVGSVLTLMTYCLYRVLTLPPVEVEDLSSPLQVDVKDK
jgi:hypothetical protein